MAPPVIIYQPRTRFDLHFSNCPCGDEKPHLSAVWLAVLPQVNAINPSGWFSRCRFFSPFFLFIFYFYFFRLSAPLFSLSRRRSDFSSIRQSRFSGIRGETRRRGCWKLSSDWTPAVSLGVMLSRSRCFRCCVIWQSSHAIAFQPACAVGFCEVCLWGLQNRRSRLLKVNGPPLVCHSQSDGKSARARL